MEHYKITNIFVGINGIESDGSSSTDKVLKLLYENYDCKIIDYSFRKSITLFNLIFNQNYQNKKYQLDLAIELKRQVNQLESPPNLIAHSFGCLLAIKSLSLGMKANTLFLFSPAVESDEIITTINVLDKVYIIYNSNDLAIKLGKLLKFHNFGDMGNNGYDYPNDKIMNIKYHAEKELTFMEQLYQVMGFNHSDYFLNHNINDWIQFISDKTNLKLK